MKLLKAMATVAGLTAVSRVAGFIRDILTAAFLGAGPLADAFFVALKLPNFFRRVTAEGAFSVAFIPVYSETLEREGEEAARTLASRAFAMMFWILAALTLMAWVGMHEVIQVIAPGFESSRVHHDVRFDMAVDFSRITFPYLLFMSLTALMGGMLNTHNKFAPFAVAPVLFNGALIVALLLSPHLPVNAGFAMSWGIFAAGVLQALFLFYFICRYRIGLRLAWPRFSPKIKHIFALMGPGIIGAGVVHINLFADLIIASFLEEGSISVLYYADRLNQLPLGTVGIAVGTALLPMLSKAIAAKNTDEARELYSRALEYCLLLGLPAAAALFVMPHALIHVLFERGAFSAEATAVTAQVLRGYAIGLPAYIGVKVLSTAYWAQQDTVTPVKISVVTTLINIGLSLVFIQFMGVAGIALATGLVGWLQFYLLQRRLKGHAAIVFDAQLRRAFPRILLSVAGMAFVLLLANHVLYSALYDDATLTKICALMALVALGLITYASCAMLTGALNLKTITQNLKRKS